MSLANRRTIVGLIDAVGAGGESIGQTEEWFLTFSLAGWRHPGSAIVVGDRYCKLAVSESDLESLTELLQAFSIVEAEIEDESNVKVTMLHRIVRTDVKDPELEQLASVLQEPIVFTDPTFGRLEYDRMFGWFAGRAEWCGQAVDVGLECAQPEDPAAVLRSATLLFADQGDWQHRVEEFAVEKLLALKNDSWLDDDDIALSAGEFLSKMTLESITVSESGNFTFRHDDGDLFWGHTIQIDGSFSAGLTRADIPG